MSEVEHVKGRIKLVKFPPSFTFDDKMDFLKESGQIKESDYELDDKYIDWRCAGFIAIGSDVFEIIDHEDVDPDQDISNLRKMSSESYEYEFRFYNGGTCFSEMLKEALDSLDEK